MEADKIDYPAILVALKAKRAVIDSAIAGIEILAGEPQGSASLTFIGNLPENGVVKTPEKDIDAGILNEHAFFGMSASKGAQKYLNIRKKPATAAEIAQALIDGGFPSQSGNFGSTITTTLFRNPNTFVKVKRGTWGLKSWYPNYRAKDKDEKADD